MRFQNTVINADCVRALSRLRSGSVDFILTDPPYVRRYQDARGRIIPNDNFRWLEPAFRELFRVLKSDAYCVSFYGWAHIDKFANAFRDAGFGIAGHLAFTKTYVSGQRHLAYQHESAYLLTKGEPRPRHRLRDVVDWEAPSGNRWHPSQKPLSVLTPLVEAFSAPGDLLLDPFAGSGSALVAAKRLGRRYLGIDLDAGYCAAARSRLATESTPADIAA